MNSKRRKKSKVAYLKLMNCEFTTLILCGGGVKCTAFCGSIRFIQEFKIYPNIKKIIGTSAGALVALLLILGYDWKEIDIEIDNLHSSKILKYDINAVSILSIPTIMYQLFNYHGIDNGDNFRNTISNLFIQKNIPPNITFIDLYNLTGRELFITATCINDRSSHIFNYTNSPKIQVIDAVLASACIPILFVPVIINNKLYIDGGLLNNFPINLVNSNENVLALKLNQFTDNDYEPSNKIQNFLQYLYDILDIILINSWNDAGTNYNNIIVCSIDIPSINFIDFNISSELRQVMKNNGYDCLYKKLFNDNVISI